MNRTLNKARSTLLVEKKPDDALSLLLPWMQEQQKHSLLERRPLIELVALAYEFKQEYDEAASCFLSIEDFYQSGYCRMLKGDLESAFDCWKNLLAMRSNHWCLTLSGLVTGHLSSVPTFLQIRNHLEADVVHLVQAGQDLLVTNMMRYAGVLADINFETYKFLGRGLLNAGKLGEAGVLLLKGQQVLPNDPEIYYHLGQYYHALGNRTDALLMLQQCVLISPHYTPARWLLEELRQASP